MCIYTLKEVISFYQKHGSNIFIGFLDASKVFDRVNHWKLLKKLIIRGMPVLFVRLLAFFLSTQELYVKWGNVKSNVFKASNGVRQGSVLSPILFNIYMDDLSVSLVKSNAGCYINKTCSSHLMYADDICLLAPSAKGLQKLIDICESYSVDNDLLFNATKSVCMYLNSSAFKLRNIPKVFLNNVPMQCVNSYKYLGHILCASGSDNSDIQQQVCKFYARANSLIRNFSYCSWNVKSTLFNSFCTSV